MNQKEIKKIIEELLKKTSVNYEEIELKNKDGRLVFVIKTNDSKILIGRNGVNIHSFQHLVYKIIDKKFGRERNHFSIDVNDYYEKQTNSLKRNAQKQGERAIFFKHDVELEPMSAYERMIVHSLLSENPQIETQSSGEGENRHIVIHYKN